MITMKRRLTKTLKVTVHYLTGQLTLEVSLKTTGKELFLLVCACLGIREFWYFGLQYESKRKQLSWLRPGPKVVEVVGKFNLPFYFLVKYFPDDVTKLNDEAALGLIYYQCKNEVLSGAIFCSPETSILLASYVLQAENGDWAHIKHETLNPKSLVPLNVFSQYHMPEKKWGTSLRDWHKDHEGLTTKEAQRQYLRIAQELSMFGVSYFPIKSDIVPSWVGIHPKGISLYEGSLLSPKVVLKWVFIKMVNFSCKKFIVKTVLDSAPSYVFNMKKVRSAKQVFELAVGYHHIHMRNRYLPSRKIYDELESEKFRETTEEFCSAPVHDIHQEVFGKHFRRERTNYKLLPTLNEE